MHITAKIETDIAGVTGSIPVSSTSVKKVTIAVNDGDLFLLELQTTGSFQLPYLVHVVVDTREPQPMYR